MTPASLPDLNAASAEYERVNDACFATLANDSATIGEKDAAIYAANDAARKLKAIEEEAADLGKFLSALDAQSAGLAGTR